MKIRFKGNGRLLVKFKNLIGSGLYLLCMVVLIEALAILINHWVSLPIPLAFEIQVFLTFLLIISCIAGIIWFNTSLNLIKTYVLGGEVRLVTVGPFNYVRHPLYATLLFTLPPLLIVWQEDIVFVFSWMLIYVFGHIIVGLEERTLEKIFSHEYQKYQQYVPALVPYKGAGGKHYRKEKNNFK